jgi:O-antigen/teichoic acid export membrane protein
VGKRSIESSPSMILRQAIRHPVATARSVFALPADTFSIFLLHMLSLGVGLAASIPVARLLGPTQKGVLNLFSLLTGLITEFGLFGLNSGLLYRLANRKTTVATVHAAALWGSVLLGSLCFSIILVFRPLFSKVFEGLPTYFVVVAGCLGPFLLYRTLWSNLVIGINRTVHSYRVNFAFSALSLVGLFFLWGIGWLTAPNVIWLSTALLVAYCAYGFYFLGAAHGFRFEPAGPCLLDALKYGSAVYIGVVCNYLHFRIDQMMINHFQGSRGVGIYTVSIAFAEALWLIDYSVINAALFRISSLEAEASWEYSWRVFRMTSLLLIAGGMLLGLGARPLVHFLYGSQYREAVLPLILLVPGVAAWGGGRVLSQFISYNAGKPHLTSAAAILGAAINILGNLYAIPRWGIAGAAVTSSVSYIATLTIVGVVFAALGRRLKVAQCL